MHEVYEYIIRDAIMVILVTFNLKKLQKTFCLLSPLLQGANIQREKGRERGREGRIEGGGR